MKLLYVIFCVNMFMGSVFLNTKFETAEENTGQCLLTKMKSTSQTSANSDQLEMSRLNCHIRVSLSALR